MNVNYTGVFATEEEIIEIVRLADRARKTPVIRIGSCDADAWEDCHKRCHAAALAHGLPEIEGYYGLDPERKEFITT